MCATLRVVGLRIARLPGAGPFRFPLLETKESLAGTMNARKLESDFRQHSAACRVPFTAILQNNHMVALAPLFSHELRSRSEAYDSVACDIAVALHSLRQIGEAALHARAQTAISLLLDLPSNPEPQQV